MGWLRNTSERFGAPAIALHWAMALLLVGLVASGLVMSRMPDVGFDTRKIVLILYHKQAGVLALALALFRLAWRVGNALPALVATLPRWQQVTARLVHLCFYALMFVLPVTGWLMSSAGGFPVSFLGLFELPDLIAPSDYRFRGLIEIHQWLGYALLALTGVHAGAALRHHFLLGDATLRKMLPGGSSQPAAHY
ncbi:MAG TPA: cytochrome b [Ramlibacter sp.]|nr:cytochrome b [Ramlibacter sp.]